MPVPKQHYDPQLRRLVPLLRLVFGHDKTPQQLGKPSRSFEVIGALGRTPRGVRRREEFIPRPDGTQLRLVILEAEAPETNRARPGILSIHGGGYAMGAPEWEAAGAKRVIDVTGALVVMPAYRRSREAPYPAALDDCYLALTWMKDHADELGFRSDQLAVGGFSAGGGLTAAVSLLARDRGEVNIAFQFPVYPMIDDRETNSNRDNDAPIWDTVTNRSGWQLYLGKLWGTDRVPAYAAPARATDFAGLPPTITYVGSVEPFYDETVTYVERLREAGVEVAFRVFPGGYHGFDGLPPGTRIGREAAAWFRDQLWHAVRRYFAPQPGEAGAPTQVTSDQDRS